MPVDPQTLTFKGPRFEWNIRWHGGVYVCMFRFLSVVLVFLAPSLPAQMAPANRSPSGHALITVSVRPAQSQIAQGDDLGVEIILTAGADGAYLPNYFGDFMRTCFNGFWAEIITEQGHVASDANKGCAVDELVGSTSASELLAKRFIFLKPGETRLWHTTLTRITTAPGSYEVQAGYITSRDQAHIEEIAALPQVHGLMVLGRVDAKPVKVKIE
jgi:hypothetical protein